MYQEEWKAAYEREAYAYALLAYRGVRRCIPEVYWKGELPKWRWNGGHGEFNDPNGLLYGLVMEWFEDCQQVEFSTLDIPTAEAIGRALDRVHAARVMHGDLQGQNILLVREHKAVRVVLIDFSVAWLNCHHWNVDNEYDGFLGKLLHRMVWSFLSMLIVTRTPKY